MTTQQHEATRLTQQIVKHGGVRALKRIKRMHAKIDKRRKLTPMATILAKIPWPEADMTLTARAKYLTISRQAYYEWLNERARPSLPQAEKLAQLTGLTVEEIRGV